MNLKGLIQVVDVQDYARIMRERVFAIESARAWRDFFAVEMLDFVHAAAELRFGQASDPGAFDEALAALQRKSEQVVVDTP